MSSTEGTPKGEQNGCRGGLRRVLMSLALLLPGADFAAEPVDWPGQLQAAVADMLVSESPLHHAENLRRDTLGAFYTGRARQPAWVDNQGVLTPAGAYLLNVLQHADAEAVDPQPLHIEALQRLRAVLTPTPQQLAEMDVLLSDGAMRYGSALQPNLADPAAALNAALAENRVEAFLADLPPAQSGYRKLKAFLARYQTLAAAGGWPSIPIGPTPTAGKDNPQVQPLRRHLILEGDYTEVVPALPKGRRQRLEPGLVTALKRFQARNGLHASGKLDATTRAVLNIPVGKRIEQIRANLVRWRSLPHDLGTRYLLVNVLAYSVDALENSQKRFSLRAIVGRPDRPTPSLVSDVSSIIFNPSWHVPTKLASEDLAPKQLKDPSFFTKQKIHVYSSWGKRAVEIDPARINWAQIEGTKFPYKLRQDPGPENSLGHIKFAFENAFDVYLHDTPKRSLFAKPVRALSSGCVRVDQPMKLAAYLLGEQPSGEWSVEKIKETIAAGKRKTVRLQHPMRIYLVYWSAWVDDEEQLQFRQDIYGLDSPSKSCTNGVCVAQHASPTEH